MFFIITNIWNKRKHHLIKQIKQQHIHKRSHKWVYVTHLIAIHHHLKMFLTIWTYSPFVVNFNNNFLKFFVIVNVRHSLQRLSHGKCLKTKKQRRKEDERGKKNNNIIDEEKKGRETKNCDDNMVGFVKDGEKKRRETKKLWRDILGFVKDREKKEREAKK